MTVAEFRQVGERFEAKVTGHAGYNRNGPDIVCSACSMLSCTLLQCMMEQEAAGGLREFHQSARGASVYLSVAAQPSAQARVEAAFHTIISGFALLARDYPDHVRLYEKRTP